ETRLTSRQNSGSTRGRPATPSVLDRVGRHECPAQARCDHRQRPVVAIAPINRPAMNVLGSEHRVGIARKLAVHAVDVALAIEIFDANTAAIRQAVIRLMAITICSRKRGMTCVRSSGALPGMQ